MRSVVALGIALTALLAGAAALQRGQAQGEVRTVEIVDFGFRPVDLTIPSGTTVEWVNTGNATHTSTSDSGVWDSGPLAGRSVGGGRFRFTFVQPGVYAYHCEPHPFMTGTIVVVGPAATPPPTVTPTAHAPPSPTPSPSPTATPPPLPSGGRLVARVVLPAVFRARER